MNIRVDVILLASSLLAACVWGCEDSVEDTGQEPGKDSGQKSGQDTGPVNDSRKCSVSADCKDASKPVCGSEGKCILGGEVVDINGSTSGFYPERSVVEKTNQAGLTKWKAPLFSVEENRKYEASIELNIEELVVGAAISIHLYKLDEHGSVIGDPVLAS